MKRQLDQQASQSSDYNVKKERTEKEQANFSDDVAKHYNNIEQLSVRARKHSQIIDLRAFNNGIKDYQFSKTIKFLQHVPKFVNVQYNVLEMGCGKGGDLMKYSEKNVRYYLGVDIADVSIKQAKGRYDSMRGEKPPKVAFKADFIVSDLTRDTLREEIKKQLNAAPTHLFHVVSAQFCIHYSYESFAQAIKFLQNAHDNLETDGIFIGIYPDGALLHKLAQANGGVYEVGDNLKVTFDKDCKRPKAFGTKYHFYLKEVVDCPEFVIHPTVMKKLFEAFGFYEVYDRSFEEFVELEKKNYGELITEALRKFNAVRCVGEEEVNQDPEQYKHVKGHIGQNDQIDPDDLKKEKVYVGTLPLNMWKVASIYRIFCYKKRGDAPK